MTISFQNFHFHVKWSKGGGFLNVLVFFLFILDLNQWYRNWALRRWNLCQRRSFRRSFSCLVTCRRKCRMWQHAHARKITVMQMSTKMKVLLKSGRQENSESRRSMFNALATTRSHAGMHHHSSWIVISAMWARRDLGYPEWLSLSVMEWCAIVCFSISFPFLQSFAV